jgi:hypothetical protein
LLEQKVASGEVKDTLPYAGDSAYEFFHEEDDDIPVGKSTDHELREALDNMASKASDGLDFFRSKLCATFSTDTKTSGE